MVHGNTLGVYFDAIRSGNEGDPDFMSMRDAHRDGHSDYDVLWRRVIRTSVNGVFESSLYRAMSHKKG